MISQMEMKNDDDDFDSASSSEKLKSESEDFFSCESSEESYDLIEARTKLIKAKYNELLDNTVVTENAEEENMEFSRTKWNIFIVMEYRSKLISLVYSIIY